MDKFGRILEQIRGGGVYRALVQSRPRGSRIELGGGEVFNFATNDYLGISSDFDIQSEFLSNLDKSEFLMSAVSSRLLGGDSRAFEMLEKYFADLFSASGAPRECLLFNGGYHANTGILPALADKNDAVFCDKLVHASLIDALKLSPCKFFRFAHNNLDHLRSLLESERGNFENVFIVTESVFSMDGDTADLRALVSLKREFGAFLYVDEAHSFGVRGGGLGLCAELGIVGDVDIIMCTLGKAVASQGAVAVVPHQIRELLVNRARPFIFTTAMPPLSALWTRFVFDKILKMDDRRAALRQNADFLRGALSGAEVLGDSQIVPAVVGGESAAERLAQRLLERGYWTPAVRYPTVPKNSARLRLSLNAKMSKSELEIFAREFENLRGK